MASILQFLKTFDTFGVPLTMRVDADSHIYKSVVGGLVTLSIYILSFCYAFYVFYLWETNEMSPKMSSTQYMSTFKNLDLNYETVLIYYWLYDKSLLDPFTAHNNIITPLIQTIYKNGSIEYISILDQESNSSLDVGSTVISAGDIINQFYSNGSVELGITKTLIFAQCDQKYLKNTQTCASDEIIAQFLNQADNCIVLNIRSKLLDAKQQPVISTYNSYFYIEPTLTYSFNADLKTNTYYIRNQIFSSAQTEVEYLSGQTVYGQTNTMELAVQTYGLKVFGSMYLTLQKTQTLVIIEYPHIAELLAQIGSIVSVLFILQYLIMALNQHFLWMKIVNQTITYFYPQFSQIKIIYDYRNRIKSVKLGEKTFDTQQFQLFHKDLIKRVNDKLTFNNIIYEISRLYLIIRSMQTQAQMQQCHQIGIDFNCHGLQLRSTIIDSPESYPDMNILTDNDLDLISLHRKNHCQYLVDDELSKINDFYDRNRIN